MASTRGLQALAAKAVLSLPAYELGGFSRPSSTTLWGLQTRAIPAGVNGPPLQTTIIIVESKLYCCQPRHSFYLLCKKQLFVLQGCQGNLDTF